jgi:hypothetical protein
MQHKPKPRCSGEKGPSGSALLARLQPDAAGIDCGQHSHFVAVPPDRDPQSVREFRTFTTDLQRLADWLVQCGIKTVAMESTGGLLDSSLREPGAAWLRGAAGQRP